MPAITARILPPIGILRAWGQFTANTLLTLTDAPAGRVGTPQDMSRATMSKSKQN
jgi:hypothetical protein